MTIENKKKWILFIQRVAKMRNLQIQARESKTKGLVGSAKSFYNESEVYSALVDGSLQEAKEIIGAMDQINMF